MQQKLKKIFIYLFLIFLIFISLSGYFFYKLNQKATSADEVIVTLQKNASVSLIVNTFNKEHLLEPGWMFKLYLKLYSSLLEEKVYPGTYKFSSENSNLDVVRSVFSGKQRFIVKITYPEGITLADFASITARNLDIDSAEFISLCKDAEILKEYGIKSKTAEGYLMPETYNFFWKTPVREVVIKLLDQFRITWESINDKSNLKNMTQHEILTLASIVEAETPVKQERPIIAGVYLNRLRIGMKLEADPTVQYALKGKKRLTYKDLTVDNPYNTYEYKGLPPGPINSPSKSSIEAALKPTKNDFIFFVAVGDGSGRHNFAKNFTQHQINRSKYKKNLREN